MDFQADLSILRMAIATKNRNEMADDIIPRVALTFGYSDAAFILCGNKEPFLLDLWVYTAIIITTLFFYLLKPKFMPRV